MVGFLAVLDKVRKQKFTWSGVVLTPSEETGRTADEGVPEL